jgi:hypothetical protein
MGFSFKPVRPWRSEGNLFQGFLTLVQNVTFNGFQLLCQVRKLVVIPPATQPHPRMRCALRPLPACGEGIKGWGSLEIMSDLQSLASG